MKSGHRVHFLILSFLILNLSACGFQLRGAYLEALQNSRIYIQSANANALAAEVKQQLLDADVTTVTTAAEADYIVTLSNEAFDTKVLSVSPATGKVEEYEVTYTALLAIATKDKKAVPNTETISASRDYTFDEGSVLGKFDEEAVLKKDITKQTAESVIRRLRAAVQ